MMKNVRFIKRLSVIFMMLFGACVESTMPDPLTTVQGIADRVIKETIFDFQLVEKQETHGLQHVDFSGTFGVDAGQQVAYALSFVSVNADTALSFGISYTGKIDVWINGETVFSGESKDTLIFREYTYDRFHFDDRFHVSLNKGCNKVLIRSERKQDDPRWLFFLHPLDVWGHQNYSVRFTLENFAPAIRSDNWLIAGPFHKESESFLKNELFANEKPADHFLLDETHHTWQVPQKILLRGFIMKDTFAFSRESYADWHYAIGAMNMVLLALAEKTNRPDYIDYVEQYNNFVVDQLPYFSHEYHRFFAIRNSYHRLVRATMLDDCGAPALSMLQLYLEGGGYDHYRDVLVDMADWVANKQERLPDGTFCRPEPYPMTIWADDLFMSVPFMLRMAELTGDSLWYDDVVLQARQFHHYLYDSAKGVYKHGYFVERGETSPVHWARANGWVSWALAEALLRLPVNYPGYQEISDIYSLLMEGLRTYQSSSGLWHQVLDQPGSYLETSASAMFVLAMARGVAQGWLDETYRDVALRGWSGISGKTTQDGVVSGICRGTPIGESLQFYFDRATFDNDPRGLGAVIQAGLDVHLLLNHN